MTNFETKIIILQDNLADCIIDDEFRDEYGALSICVPESANVNFNYKQKDISELENLVSDYTNSFEFYPENRTLLLLNYIHNKRSFDGEQKIRAVLLVDGIKFIDGYIGVLESEEIPISGMVKYKIQIIGTHQTWKNDAKNLALCDIDLGQYEWTLANVLATMRGASMQIDGQPSVYPWLANFGEWINGNEVVLQDLRYLIYSRAILIAGFCKLGYEVFSDFANSEYFRRQGEYILKPDFYNYSNRGQQFRARYQLSLNQSILVVGVPVEVREIIMYNDDFSPPNNEDPGNNYNTGTFRYTNNTGAIVNVQLTIQTTVRFSILGLLKHFRIELDAFVQGSFSTSVLNEGVVPGSDTDATVTFTTLCVALDPADWFEVYAVTVGFNDGINPPIAPDPMQVIAGSYVSVEPCAKIIHTGDTFTVSDMVRCDISFYDWLQDVTKMFNLRFATHEARKRVYIEPFPGRYEMYQQFLQTGSFTGNKLYRGFEGVPEESRSVMDLTERFDVCEGVVKSFTNPKLPQSYQFSFKKDSNEKFDFVNDFTDESPPFSKTVLVPGGTESPTKVTLNITAVTFNDFDDAIKPLPTSLAPYIPFLWNTERLPSGGYPPKGFAYERRVVYIHGWVEQKQGQGGQVAEWVFEGVTYGRVPTTAMYFPYFISTDSGDLQPDANVIFGSPNVEKDLVTTFYLESIFAETVEIRHTLKVAMTNLEVFNYLPQMILLLNFNDSALNRFSGYYRVESLSKRLNGFDLATLEVRLKALFTC